MIGNLWEMTSDWYGQGGDGQNGSQPAEYFGDGYWNVDAAESQEGFSTHFPAIGLRGGHHGMGVTAGVFTMHLGTSPRGRDAGSGTLGFRCAMGFLPHSGEGE